MKLKKRAAILGATGHIGKAVFSSFTGAKIDIEACSKNGGEVMDYSVDKVDISRNGNLSKWLENKHVDAIIYLSCKIPKTFFEADWDLFYHNLKMHKQVLDYWKTHKCHLIYASGCSIYSNNSPHSWEEEKIVYPGNFYSFSKLIGEVLFYQEYRKGLPLTILRISSPYGNAARRKTVVNIFIERALKGKDLFLFKGGNEQRDFIHVFDIARAFWITYSDKKYGIYNIASGKTTTIKELAKMIISLTDSSSKLNFLEERNAKKRFQVRIDISKARNELGFLPEYSLEDGLKKCISRYRENGL